MTARQKPLSEVNCQAIRVLSEQLGLVDTFRFVNQFRTGHGDYAQERDRLFTNLTLDEIVSAIEQKNTEKAKE
jgi:hypothetical protein